MEKQNPPLFCSYLTYSIKTSPKLFFCNRCVVSLPWVAPHLHGLSCSELEASEGEDGVQERGHGKSSNSQAAAAALFVLKTNVRAATIARFVAVPSVQCCRLRWQNRATGADSGLLTPRAAAAAGDPSSEAPKAPPGKSCGLVFFLPFPLASSRITTIFASFPCARWWLSVRAACAGWEAPEVAGC